MGQSGYEGVDVLDSLMHDNGAGLHTVTSDSGQGLVRERVGDGRRVDDHGVWCVGNPDQVDTRLDRHQVSGRGTAWNENKIAGPGGGVRGGV